MTKDDSKPRKLPPKRQRFVDEYLIDLNATQAAIRAGYSAGAAKVTGCRLLADANVRSAIAEGQGLAAKRTEITVDRVLNELAKIGFQDPRALFTESGALIPVTELSDDAAASVASVEVVTRPTGERDAAGNAKIEYVHKIKTWDKRAALVDIGKHIGMFVERQEVTVKERVVGSRPMQEDAWEQQYGEALTNGNGVNGGNGSTAH